MGILLTMGCPAAWGLDEKGSRMQSWGPVGQIWIMESSSKEEDQYPQEFTDLL